MSSLKKDHISFLRRYTVTMSDGEKQMEVYKYDTERFTGEITWLQGVPVSYKHEGVEHYQSMLPLHQKMNIPTTFLSQRGEELYVNKTQFNIWALTGEPSKELPPESPPKGKPKKKSESDTILIPTKFTPKPVAIANKKKFLETQNKNKPQEDKRPLPFALDKRIDGQDAVLVLKWGMWEIWEVGMPGQVSWMQDYVLERNGHEIARYDDCTNVGETFRAFATHANIEYIGYGEGNSMQEFWKTKGDEPKYLVTSYHPAVDDNCLLTLVHLPDTKPANAT